MTMAEAASDLLRSLIYVSCSGMIVLGASSRTSSSYEWDRSVSGRVRVAWLRTWPAFATALARGVEFSSGQSQAHANHANPAACLHVAVTVAPHNQTRSKAGTEVDLPAQ